MFLLPLPSALLLLCHLGPPCPLFHYQPQPFPVVFREKGRGCGKTVTCIHTCSLPQLAPGSRLWARRNTHQGSLAGGFQLRSPPSDNLYHELHKNDLCQKKRSHTFPAKPELKKKHREAMFPTPAPKRLNPSAPNVQSP